MSTSRKTTSKQAQSAAAASGLSSVMNVGVRVAGRVPTRVDLRFAGTAEQQLGLSLGTVLVYLRTYLCARTVALGWGEAAAQARSLSPVLPERRRPAMVAGPWSVAAVVRLAGMPAVTSTLLPAVRRAFQAARSGCDVRAGCRPGGRADPGRLSDVGRRTPKGKCSSSVRLHGQAAEQGAFGSSTAPVCRWPVRHG